MIIFHWQIFLCNSWDLCCSQYVGSSISLLSWSLSLPFLMMVLPILSSLVLHATFTCNCSHKCLMMLCTLFLFVYMFSWFMNLFVGTIMTISKDRVKPSPIPDSWKLSEIFATGIVIGSYLALTTVLFFWATYKTDFFPVNEFSSWSYSSQSFCFEEIRDSLMLVEYDMFCASIYLPYVRIIST